MARRGHKWDTFGVDPFFDPGFTPEQWMREWYARDCAASERFGTGHALSRVKDGPFTIEMVWLGKTDDGPLVIHVMTHTSRPKKPVPAGRLMFWWEKSHEQVRGITRNAWSKLTMEQQAEAEAWVQLNNWVPFQFWGNYARWYYPKEYGNWARKQDDLDPVDPVAEEYWRKRMARK